MTDAHTPAVLGDEDQGSLRAARSVPTEPLDDPWAELERLAQAATPGPWFQCGLPWFSDGSGVLAGSPDPHVGVMIADTENWNGAREEAADGYGGTLADADDDAAFIAAANPATILKLIEAARQGPAGYGAKRSEPNPSQPTPVRGLEPVAWRWRAFGNKDWRLGHLDPKVRGSYEVEPLYSASDVSALQGEVERLRKALKKIAAAAHPMRCSLTNLNDRIRIATKALGEQQ